MDITKFVSSIKSVSDIVSAWVSVNATKELPMDVDENSDGESSKCVTDFLTSPLGDPKDLIMRKAMATAMVIAKKKGVIQDVPADAPSLASLVDESLTKVKTATMVGLGKLNPERAIDALIDGAQARVVSVVDTALDSGIVSKFATEGLVKLAHAIPKIGMVVGPIAQSCKPAIQGVLRKAEKAVKPYVKKGIQIVANTAKTVCKKAVEFLKEKAWNIAGNLLKSVLS